MLTERIALDPVQQEPTTSVTVALKAVKSVQPDSTVQRHPVHLWSALTPSGLQLAHRRASLVQQASDVHPELQLQCYARKEPSLLMDRCIANRAALEITVQPVRLR